MSDALPQKTAGDYLHLTAKVGLSAFPVVGGPAAELFNAIIAPPIEKRRNDWLNHLEARLRTLEQEKRLKIEDLRENQEFVTAILEATTVALRNHHQEKIDALRNAVLNSALGNCPSDVKSALFLAFVDQFTVWHLKVMKELSDQELKGQATIPKTSIETIAEVVLERIAALRGQQALAETVVEDLCRKGLLFWSGGRTLTYIPPGTSQLTGLGQEFLKYISGP